MGCRKNLTRLTLAEKQAFINALLTMKANGDFDGYADLHMGAGGHGHGGPAFFPWHRELVVRFERDLQTIDPSVDVPYWDWTVENLNSSGTASLIWSDDFMGGPGVAANGFLVETGPFSSWGLTRNAFSIFNSAGGGGSIAASMTSPDYTTFRSVEGPHGGAHIFVGGNAVTSRSPEDPVFWLIHCNVDRLWAEWINQHQGDPAFVIYAPEINGPTGHNLNDTLWPWNGTTSPFGVPPWTVVPENVRPSDLLDHRALGYYYDTVDLECRRIFPKPLIKERLTKELIKDRTPKGLIKDRLPKELIKDRDPKELMKDRSPKELIKDRDPKELTKDRSPKELKEIREGDPGSFIRPDLRPDLVTGALNFEPDLTDAELNALRLELEARGNLARGRG